MKKIEERNERFYTEKGLAALQRRLENFAELFNKNKFPFETRMFGFGSFFIFDQDECLSRMKELSELTGSKITLTTNFSKGKETSMKSQKVKIEHGGN